MGNSQAQQTRVQQAHLGYAHRVGHSWRGARDDDAAQRPVLPALLAHVLHNVLVLLLVGQLIGAHRVLGAAAGQVQGLPSMSQCVTEHVSTDMPTPSSETTGFKNPRGHAGGTAVMAVDCGFGGLNL